MQWPEHPVFPNYGYTITRFNLDGLVAEQAEKYGADVLNGVEALGLLDATAATDQRLVGAQGVVVKDKETGETGEIRGRYVVAADGQNSRLGRDLGVTRNRDWPLGMALRGYYTSDRHDEPWIDSHLDIRDSSGDVVPGYGWVFPLGDGRVNVGVGSALDRRQLEGRQHHQTAGVLRGPGRARSGGSATRRAADRPPAGACRWDCRSAHGSARTRSPSATRPAR